MFPADLEWVNVARLRMDKQRGRPVLIEFWDFCRANSLRVLPQIKAWHEAYAQLGLRVISVHAGAYEPSQDPDEVRAAIERLEIEHPVAIDTNFALWKLYANEGWPARYLWHRELLLYSYHYGEGGYDDTTADIHALLGLEPPVPSSEKEPELVPHSPEELGPWSGSYAAGAVWGVFDGSGTVVANGNEIEVRHPGVFALVEHERHTEGELDLQVGDGVTCHAVQFTPGSR